jgi:ubiquinone/menaquinone biosynthesis C-methylase UbiE
VSSESRHSEVEPFSFDQQATAFDQRAGLPAPVATRIAKAIVDVAEPADGDVLLELGAGTGQIGSDLAASQRLRYLGLDISRPMLVTFRSKLGPGSALVHADADGGWPVASGTIRAVFLARSLHLLSTERVASEASRVNQGGMRILVGGVKREDDSLRARMRDKMRSLLAEHGIQGRGRGSAAKKLFSALEASGAQLLPTVDAAVWDVHERPIDSIRGWTEKSGLAGAEIDSAAKREVLDALRVWAEETFGDLDAEQRSTERYELQVLHLP